MRRLFWGHWNCSIVHDVQMVPVIGIIVVAFHFALPSMVMLPSFLAHTMYGMPVCFSFFKLILFSKSKNHDMVGVKNIIRIGNYMIGSVLAAVRIVTIVTSFQLPRVWESLDKDNF